MMHFNFKRLAVFASKIYRTDCQNLTYCHWNGVSKKCLMIPIMVWQCLKNDWTFQRIKTCVGLLFLVSAVAGRFLAPQSPPTKKTLFLCSPI